MRVYSSVQYAVDIERIKGKIVYHCCAVIAHKLAQWSLFILILFYVCILRIFSCQFPITGCNRFIGITKDTLSKIGCV